MLEAIPLFKCAHLEHVNLVLSEETPIATLYILLGKSGKVYSVELYHLVTKVFEDTTYDTVATAMYLDTHLLLVGLVSLVDSICMYLAVLKSDALGNLADVGSCYVLVAVNVVNLLLQILGMSELGSQVAIVGEK